MTKGIIINNNIYGEVYGQQELKEISELLDLCAPIQKPETVLKNPSILQPCEVIMTGWGAPKFDSELLRHAPNLRAIFYAGGGIKGVFDKDLWDKELVLCNAYAANAIPTAMYSVSQILACLKGIGRYSKMVRDMKAFPDRSSVNIAGTYQCTVGLVSLGMIGRQVCKMLQNFPDMSLIAYDPYIDEEQAREYNIEMCSLESVFERSDVVSVHTPWLKETENLIGEDCFKIMKPNSSFINTARGQVVCEPEMIKILRTRPDITAVLDVTNPEPPKKDSPLYILPNVVLTPHIAGSICGECARLGRYMVDELKRYLQGKPLKWCINLEQYQILA